MQIDRFYFLVIPSYESVVSFASQRKIPNEVTFVEFSNKCDE